MDTNSGELPTDIHKRLSNKDMCFPREFTSWCTKCHICSKNHRSEEHTSELQSQSNLVCRLLLEKKKLHTFPPRVLLTATLQLAVPLLVPQRRQHCEDPAPHAPVAPLFSYAVQRHYAAHTHPFSF